jgi:hypothetical protein
MRLRTKILQAGKTATGIQVPNEIVEGLGSGKRPAVRVTINVACDSWTRTVAFLRQHVGEPVRAGFRSGALRAECNDRNGR